MSREFQDAEEHFREFDANILQSAMDVQVYWQLWVVLAVLTTCIRDKYFDQTFLGQEEARAVEDPPVMDEVGSRHERARLDHHYNAERPATHRRAPLGGVSHGSVVPLVHRQRGPSHSMIYSNTAHAIYWHLGYSMKHSRNDVG